MNIILQSDLTRTTNTHIEKAGDLQAPYALRDDQQEHFHLPRI